MAVLVTGASGFLGGRLVEKLVEQGHDVVTFGRTPDASPRLAGIVCKHVQGDLSDPDSIRRALSGCSVVYHLAGLVSYRKSDYKPLYEANVVGARNMMTACLGAGVERVIHMGSIAGMGIPPEGSIADESIEYNLKGLGLYYCDTKYEGEQEVMKFARQGLPILVLNPGITFGEGDTHPHHHTIFHAMSGGWLLCYPVGGVMFSDIEDVVGTCVNAMTRGRPGERYVIGSANVTFQDAANILAGVLNGRRPVMPIPGFISEATGIFCEAVFPLFGKRPALSWQVAWLSQRKIFYSSDKAIVELGHAQTPFEETVRRTAPYYLGKKVAAGSMPVHH